MSKAISKPNQSLVIQSLVTSSPTIPMVGSSVTLIGDCRVTLKDLPQASVQCCVTSPPYWNLRDYGHADQIGQEKSPEQYVANLMAVFDEIWRVLKDDGTLWLNLGDSYAGGGNGGGGSFANDGPGMLRIPGTNKNVPSRKGDRGVAGTLKAKDLVGIPWRAAFALQESVMDRPTRSHEYIFLLTKSPKYYYDHEAIKEPCIYDVAGTGTAARKARQKPANTSTLTGGEHGRHFLGDAIPEKERRLVSRLALPDQHLTPSLSQSSAERGRIAGGYKNSVNFEGKDKRAEKQRGHSRRHDGFNWRWDEMEKEEQCTGMRNKRDVWTVPPANYAEAHFATFPPDLIKPCILAGSRPGDVVLDPFGGSGIRPAGDSM